MMDFDLLMNKYKDKIVIVDKKEPTTEIIKKLVDIKELPLEIINNKHLKITYDNAKNSIHSKLNEEIILRLYQVIPNERSREYYEDIQSDTCYLAFFEEKTVYMIADDSIGIIETNSNLLMKNVEIERGVTKNDINERNIFLNTYLSRFEDDY